MDNANRESHSAPPVDSPDPFSAFAVTLFDNLVGAQRMQLDLYMAWQSSFAAVVDELADEWACRFGGGVPIE